MFHPVHRIPRWTHLAIVIFSLTAIVEAVPGFAQAKKTTADAPQSSKLDFDKTGPQAGDQLPALNLRTIKGEVQRLDDAWKSGPALLATSSFTCPKSRSRWPELKALADKYEDQLNVVVVYVIEAHPVGSICPYKGVEDITPENERDGILRKQPASMEDRVALAQEFKRYLRIATPIYIDNMQDQAWKALGAAPNLALLVDDKGIVIAREGWFEGKKVEAAIEKHLAATVEETTDKPREAKEEAPPDAKHFKQLGMDVDDLRYAIDDTKKLTNILKQAPVLANSVFPSQQGHQEETTALMEAIDQDRLASAKLLLQHGADPKAQTKSYDSALQLAARDGKLEFVKLLLQHKGDPAFPLTGESPMHEAALGGHLDIVKMLMAAGVRPDFFAHIALGAIDDVRETLAEDSSRALLADGAGRMPLDYAAANGQLAIATLLLEHGAPVVEEAHIRLEPPLHRAIERRDAQMVELLLKAGSSANTAVGRGGEYPNWVPAIHRAVDVQDAAILKLLLAHKANVEATNAYSKTPLHAAATADNSALVNVLLEAGANPNALQDGFSLPCGSGEEETPSHNTPLHYAAARGNPETINLLIARGANLNARNADGVTPLLATFYPPLYTGDDEKVRLANIKALLAAGAEVNAHNREGHTILDAALTEVDAADGAEIIAVLKKHGARTSAPVGEKQK